MNADTPMAAALSYYTAESAAENAMLTNREVTDELARAIANGEHIKYMNEDGTF
jgi:hypothetical protein